jgi:hypothetical protein
LIVAFDRIVELSVGAAGTGLLISDLELEFHVTRSIAFEENTAEFVIYNARETTRKETLKEGHNLIFKAGYKDEIRDTDFPAIFIGNITKSTSREQEADWISEIQAASIRSSQQPLENTYVTLSYAPGIRLNIVLSEIASALGLAVFGTENAQINLQNGFVFAGSARGALNYCKAILEAEEKSLYIDNVEIVIYNAGQRTSRFSAVYLDYDSGLLSVEEDSEYNNQSPQAPKRIIAETLMIPKLKPNGLVTIRSNNVNGSFILDKVEFTGDNFGGDFGCRLEAVA